MSCMKGKKKSLGKSGGFVCAKCGATCKKKKNLCKPKKSK